jgi:hypothetical protein
LSQRGAPCPFFCAAKPDIFLATPPRLSSKEMIMRRPIDWLEQERLLFAQEMARSTRDYELALRAGMLAPAEKAPRSVQRSREVIARAKALCEEARNLRQAARLLHDRRISPPPAE